MGQVLLRTENLVKQFEGLVAVNQVTFDIQEGEILTIIGPNGAGKSVLFSMISGLHSPTSGHIYLQGKEISGLKPHTIAEKGISRTFQTTALFDQLRVVDNLAIGHRMRT
ncbi:MAG: ATP-binding cassette domain-containing protein, partial [Thermodesulfobacteriota bacterium]